MRFRAFFGSFTKNCKKTTIVSSAICMNLQKNGKSIDISRKPCYNKGNQMEKSG